MKLNIQWKKVLYGIILIVIGIILAALHFIVAGDGIRDFISSIIAVISVLVILVGTYITLSEIKFEAEEPALVKHGFHPVVVFPELDRNNQV